MRHFYLQAIISFKYAPIPLGHRPSGELAQMSHLIPYSGPSGDLRNAYRFQNTISRIQSIVLGSVF